MKCINTKLQEFIDLREASGLPSFILENKIMNWQESNNSDEFPSLTQLNVLQKSSIINEDGSRRKWLERDYSSALKEVQRLNALTKNSYELIKTTGEKGDNRVYYSIKLKDKKYTKNTDSVSILKEISKSNHVLNKVAEKLIIFAEKNNVNIEFVPTITREGIVNNTAGIYSSTANIIQIATNVVYTSSQEATILYEILHAISYKELRQNESKLEDFEKLRKFAITQLLNTNVDKYGLTDFDEFMVALFTDGQLINELMKIPAMENQKKYRNLLEEIFDYILKLFKFRKSNETLYEQAFNLATHFLDHSVIEEENEEGFYLENKLDISFTKSGFFGSFLNGYTYLNEGSESTVYSSKDGSHVIKISEPYNDNSEKLYQARIENVLMREILGNSDLELLGYYEHNGVKNPVFKQRFIKGTVLSEQEVINFLRSKENIEEIDGKFYTVYNNQVYQLDDFTDNVIMEKNGNIVPIDLDMFPSKNKEVIDKILSPVNKKIEEQYQNQLRDRELNVESFKEYFEVLGLTDSQLENVVIGIKNQELNIKCNI
jgi:hypothetical protein